MMHLNTRTDACFCTCSWWKSGWSLSSLGVRTRFHFLPKTRWNMASSEQIRLSHFLLDNLRWAQAQRTRRHLHIRTDVKLSPWVTEIRVAFLDAASDCVQWKWFSKLLLSTCGCISQSSMMVSCAMPSERSKVTHIQQRSTALPNTDWDFSGFPESCDNVMNGRWWKA